MATTTMTVAPSVHSTSIDLIDPITTHRQRNSTDLPQPTLVEDDTSAVTKPFKPTRRFWAIMFSISVMSLCGSIEGTIVVNALPTIAAALGGGHLFLWVPNALFLASIAVLPITAQVSDIFGRRTMTLGAISLYVLGNALCGASTSMTMLIAARAIQGVGIGATETLGEIIVLDLVPLRERGKYMAIVSTVTIVGFAMGPFMGGLIVERLGWPWVFYINAICGGVALILFFVFLRVKHQRGQTVWAKIKRIDFGGNFIFVGSIIAILIALTWGGPVYKWESAQILVPLIIGLLGLCAFTAFEWTPRLAPEPSFPRIIVSNRTSLTVLIMTLVQSISTTGTFYYLPVYFQGVLGKSPLESGIAIAPIATTIIPFCLVCGILLSKFGKYRPFHVFGWAITLISVSLCSTLDRNSSTAEWACYQILSAAGIGSLSVSLLPAMQAPLSEKQAATSAGMYVFARSFGMIWGVTIPSAILNNAIKRQITANTSLATDATLAARLADGQGYELATKAFLDTLSPAAREELVAVFEHAIHAVFYFFIAICALGFLLVALEKEIPLRTENKTEFGLDENRNENDGVRAGGDDVNDTSLATDGVRLGNSNDIPLEEVNVGSVRNAQM